MITRPGAVDPVRPGVATTPTASRVARPNAVLAAVCACTVLVIGFVASINLAVPQLAASDLHPSSSELLWIVDAYVLFFACLVVPAGALGDRLGRKGVLLAGLLVFGVGAVVSAAAVDVPVLLLGRVVTGIGAAGVLPNALAVLVHATDPARRPRAIAVWAAMSGVGGVVGNVGGGALLTSGSWRWLFTAAALIVAVCTVAVAVVVPRSDRTARALDPAAAVLLTLAVSAVLLAIIEGPSRGFGSATVVVALVGAVALGAAWVLTALRSAEPLLDPRLFCVPALRAACLGMLVVFFGMFGFFYLNASLLQYGRGFSVLQAGLGVVPMTVPLLVAAPRVPALVGRVGERAVLAAAFSLVAVGLFGLGTALDEPYAVYAVWLVVVGSGITLALPTLTIAISAALPPHRAGVAGGLQSTTRELGSALGVAVIGTLLTTTFTHRLGGSGARTVVSALAADPQHPAAVVAAYSDAAGVALRVVAVVVLVAGVLIVAELGWAARARTGRAQQG